MKAAKGKRIVVFLDYDGTLSPIVNDPGSAFMSKEVSHFHSVKCKSTLEMYDMRYMHTRLMHLDL